ncbi:hypothetical protein BASA61_006376 [Batrachochytrium salamandrivorans]|nr:hypothetical protein BASA61_006376 [Batrachochytrium salamandrivorans]
MTSIYETPSKKRSFVTDMADPMWTKRQNMTTALRMAAPSFTMNATQTPTTTPTNTTANATRNDLVANAIYTSCSYAETAAVVAAGQQQQQQQQQQHASMHSDMEVDAVAPMAAATGVPIASSHNNTNMHDIKASRSAPAGPSEFHPRLLRNFLNGSFA